MRLIKFPPGELPRPGTPLIQSLVLRVVLFVVYEVDETASRAGDGAVLPFVGTFVGFKTGDCTDGDELSEASGVDSLGVLFRFTTVSARDIQRIIVRGTVQERPEGTKFPVTYENLPAVCFVTAATTPPPSFPFFLSFFAPFMIQNQLRSVDWACAGRRAGAGDGCCGSSRCRRR